MHFNSIIIRMSLNSLPTALHRGIMISPNQVAAVRVGKPTGETDRTVTIAQ
jgi:hypothetical protein